ncbi:MAG: LuxR C-terminal-related transcriptional regulator [Acidobacteriota bacterium]
MHRPDAMARARRGPFVMPSQPAISLLSAQTLFRQGMTELLHRSGLHRIAEFDDGRKLCAAATIRRPDLIVVDLDHEHEDTMALVRALRHDMPATHVVAIGTPLRQAAMNSTIDASVETPDADRDELAAAARGHPRQRSVATIRERRRWDGVSPRQRDVMRWLAVGLENDAIARKLRIGIRAVKTHITNLLDHFQLSNRTQLALLADHAGLRPPTRRIQ